MRIRIAGAIAGVFLIIFLLHWLYLSVHEQRWHEHQEAIQQAYRQSDLVSVDHVDTFIAEQVYTVITGMDEDSNELIVWVGEDELHSEYATDGVSKSFIVEQVNQRGAHVNLLRLTPGFMDDSSVWEVYYKIIDDKEERHYYDYYRFKEGTWIDTYRLGYHFQ